MSSIIDFHIHSTASDGTDAPYDLPKKIESTGIELFALTDHDTLAGTEEMRRIAPKGFVPGIELSCRVPSGKCHILGYGFDPNNALLQEALTQGAALRRKKFEARLDFLREKGINFPQQEIDRLRLLPSVGKPHLANLMVQFGYARNKQDAIQNTLNLCHTGGPSRIPAEIAVQAIIAAGGISVWAHPLGGEGEKEISKENFQAMFQELLTYGLNGLECWYSKYFITQCKELAEIAKQHHLLISGGSDYHGRNKTVVLGTLNAENQPVPIDQLTIVEAFRERGTLCI